MAGYQNYQNLIKKLSLICLSSAVLFSCTKRDSITSVSASDNKSFGKRKYNKQEPIRPFGNIPDLKEQDEASVKYYNNYLNSKYNNIDENEEYLIWLNVKRKERLNAGKRNDFKAETVPGLNEYYITKTRIIKGSNTTINEVRLKDIEKKLHQNNASIISKQRFENEDEIDDYEILTPTSNEVFQKKVKTEDY